MSIAQKIPSYKMSCGNEAASSPAAATTPKNVVGDKTANNNAIKYVKVAVHFLLPSSGTVTQTLTYPDPITGATVTFNYQGAGNFTETSDGNGGSYTGYQFAEDLINNANAELSNNSVAYVKNPAYPSSYYNPPPSIPYRYLLVAVFFHRDDAMYNCNWCISQIHAKYDYMGSQVMDIYQAPNYAFGGGNLNGEALSLGGGDKALADDDYYTYITEKIKGSKWGLSAGIPGLLNHEAGHMLGLAHNWNEDDGCDDTVEGIIYKKKNPTDSLPCFDDYLNCWQYGEKPSGLCPNDPNPCLDWANVSNNIMDYNAAWPTHSYTPCQVDKIKKDLDANGTYVKSCTNNCAPPNAFFSMPKTLDYCNIGKSGVPFTPLAVNENTYSVLVSQSGKPPVKILGGAGQIGSFYDLAKYYKFLPNHTYTVSLQVDDANCKCLDQFSQQITIRECIGTDTEPPVYEIVVKNPFDHNIFINVDVARRGIMKFQLVNQLTASIDVLEEKIQIEAPSRYHYEYDTRHLPPGNYILQTIFDETLFSNNLLKIE